MNICQKHDGVMVYDGYNCPFCELEDENKNLKQEIEDRDGEISSLNEQIEYLND